MNKKKSGILRLRVDKRTPMDNKKEIHGYPIVAHYKYLGIILDESLNFKEEKINKL